MEGEAHDVISIVGKNAASVEIKHKRIRKLIITYMFYKPVFGIGHGAQHEIVYREYFDYPKKMLK